MAVGRWRGFLARQPAMTGRSEGGTSDRSGCSVRMRRITAGTASAPKGGRPLAAKIIVDAQLNRSDRGPTAALVNCSGDMYDGVPVMAGGSYEDRE